MLNSRLKIENSHLFENSGHVTVHIKIYQTFILFSQGKVVLPMPSIEVLAETAMNSDRRVAVIHVLESSVVSWMKQVKVYVYIATCILTTRQ